MTITHVFFDIGGVLGTNGWDQEQRAAAVRHFGLDGAELEDRHAEAIATLEQGRMAFDEYLRCTVFYRPRPFELDEFKAHMLAQSAPFPETIELARALARSGRYWLMTINNESAELNHHRLQQFGLRGHLHHLLLLLLGRDPETGLRIYEVASGDVPGRAGQLGVHRRPGAKSGAGPGAGDANYPIYRGCPAASGAGGTGRAHYRGDR